MGEGRPHTGFLKMPALISPAQPATGYAGTSPVAVPAGLRTCRMGRDDDVQAVLDEQMRVRGIHGLRVIDGSAMPQIVRAPTNAPIIMMAEKASDHILGKAAASA